MKNATKLGNPIFILSVVLLVVNDWLLKPVFHNIFTGKLSDFAGLFAFPFFFSTLFPKWKKSIHLFSALIFIIWKSEYVQPLIDLINGIGVPVQRTVDLTDHIALIAIYFSYLAFERNFSVKMKPFVANLLMVFSCLAFIATSLPPHRYRKFIDINKTYTFAFSKRELISRLNIIQMKEVNAMKSYGEPIDFNSESNTFHYNGSKDTLAILIDYKTIADQDTIRLKSSLAEIMIFGDDHSATLKLLSVYQLEILNRKKDYKEVAIKHFEKRVVKKIKNQI